jgi:hypothetical protein
MQKGILKWTPPAMHSILQDKILKLIRQGMQPSEIRGGKTPEGSMI